MALRNLQMAQYHKHAHAIRLKHMCMHTCKHTNILVAGMYWNREMHMQYNDVVNSAIASQITSLTIVYSSIYSDTDQSKHQSSVSLAFVRGIHRGPVDSPRKGPVTRKMFPFDDVIMLQAAVRTPQFGMKRNNELTAGPIGLISEPAACMFKVWIPNLELRPGAGVYTFFLWQICNGTGKRKYMTDSMLDGCGTRTQADILRQLSHILSHTDPYLIVVFMFMLW